MKLVVEMPDKLYENCIFMKDIHEKQLEHTNAFKARSLFEIQLVNCIANGTPLDSIKAKNLCDSCTNMACEFQYGIERSSCAFYMPPNAEPDNCGNYISVIGKGNEE